MHFEAVPEIISDYWLQPLESLEPFEKSLVNLQFQKRLPKYLVRRAQE